MKKIAFYLSLFVAVPAYADVDTALNKVILPGLDAFASSSSALADASAKDCRPDALRDDFNQTFDDWMAVGDLRIGPSETGALSIAFWPDTRGFTPKTLSKLIADQDPIGQGADSYADMSIAAKGLFALEMMLYDPAFNGYETGSYSCALVQTISADMARQAKALDAAWMGDFATDLRSAGEAGNSVFLDQVEAVRALYTQLLASVEFTADQRLGRPMGSFERPAPTKAEAWRSGRSLRNVLIAVDSAAALAEQLADDALPETAAARAHVHAVAARIVDPGFQDVTTPQGRLHVEVMQQAVRDMRTAIAGELGVKLGIAPGFNSQDGD